MCRPDDFPPYGPTCAACGTPLLIDVSRALGLCDDHAEAEAREVAFLRSVAVCAFPSSVTDAVCDLPPGHAAYSTERFHRFPEGGMPR